MTTAANDVQVGGTHYRAAYQHWDLVIDLQLDYFEAQVTKYVTRHAKKHGKQDLEKAVHYAQKAREAAAQGRLEPRHRWPTSEILNDYCRANELGDMERSCIRAACTWAGVSDLGFLVIELKALAQERYQSDSLEQ